MGAEPRRRDCPDLEHELAEWLVVLEAQGVLTKIPEPSGAELRPLARRRGSLARFLADR